MHMERTTRFDYEVQHQIKSAERMADQYIQPCIELAEGQGVRKTRDF